MGRKYGYPRVVNNLAQNLETQIELLTGFGADEIVQERVSGITKEKSRANTIT